MIIVLHRGVPKNDKSVPRLLGYYIRTIIFIDFTKIEASFLVLLHRGEG